MFFNENAGARGLGTVLKSIFFLKTVLTLQ